MCVWCLLSKKPMAMHQASINIQEPTKFKLEATRTRVEYHFHLEPNSKQALKSERNSKTQLYKFEQELLQASGIRIRAHSNQTLIQQIWTMADSAAQTTNSAIDDAAICGLKVTFSPILLTFFSLLNLWTLNSETWHHMHTSEFLNFRCQTFFCRILPIQNLSVLAHEPMKTS